MSPSPYSGGQSGSGTPQPAPISTSITIQTPDDEDDDSDDDSDDGFMGTTGYATMNGSQETAMCMHCEAEFSTDDKYIGYYCPECRPPSGFTESD